MKFLVLIFGLFLLSISIRGQDGSPAKESGENPRVGWMKGKYGIMVHWLAPGPPPQYGTRITDLNEAVNKFDLKGFLNDFDRTGAEWLIFTIGQNSGYYASPNSVIDSLAGPGHTSKRDLVLEIAREIHKRGKKFIAYLPCEIKANVALHEGFAWNINEGTDQGQFQLRYLRAIREWSVRFGQNLNAWWFDGCYDWEAFHNKYMKWDLWYKAARAGNSIAALTFNDGCYLSKRTKPVVPDNDYLSGEVLVLIDSKIRLGNDDNTNLFMPKTAYIENTKCLYHVLIPIDGYWAHGNSAYPSWANSPYQIHKPEKQEQMEAPVFSDDQLFKFVHDFTSVKGAVTLNVNIFQEGRLGEQTIQQLQRLKKSLL